MAFLRSICAQRTNLVYSYSGSSSSSFGAGKFQYIAGSKASTSWSGTVRQLSHDSKDNASELNYQQRSSSHYSTHNRYNQQQQQQLLLANALFTPNFNQHYHRVHTNASNSQTVAATQSITDDDKVSSVSRKAHRKQIPTPNVPENPQRDPLDVSFNDPIAAFKSKTTWELVRAYLVYIICSSEKLVEHNMKLMKFARTVLGGTLFELLMKSTFYGHFVAGENRHTIVPTLERLRSFGVKPILDYSVEEDLSQEEAEKREVESSVSSAGDVAEDDAMPQYHVDKSFADRRYKVNSARTYFYLNEATCERNMETFIKCLEAVSGATFGTGITAIKLTALGRPQLLLQLSEVIMRTRKYMEDLVGGQGNVLTHHKTIKDLEKYYASLGSDNKNVQEFLKNVTSDKEGILHLFPWSGIVDEDSQLSDTFRVPDPKTGQMRRLISQIPPKEEEMFRNMIRRLNTIVKTAEELDVRIMIDAEQTYFQPAISRITLEMMRKYNKDKAIVFNTYQCYLREAYQEVNTDLEQAKRQNFYFGAKLVRGAYMEQERARASALGYSDPVNPNYEATTDMYHKTLTECLRRIKIIKDSGDDAKKIGIMVASHNEDTVRYAIEKMKEIGISPEDKVICFGQLLGMCDYITFPLGQAGYSAYKYIPYGPVQEVLPYLSRRAQENKGVLKKIEKEKRLLSAEIRRRLLRGQLFYKPKGNYVPI
ncbi:proline dehydrogenase 1, mitochondrial isoform X2 [Calliphora vicina]|uniref:proline dehydrogenase 1, mitochondrial isoform X2 n=1 Tax=Calliphora vicina TaxID=7373 RepID=UPI00325BC7E7